MDLWERYTGRGLAPLPTITISRSLISDPSLICSLFKLINSDTRKPVEKRISNIALSLDPETVFLSGEPKRRFI